jgi:hypothetical protein
MNDLLSREKFAHLPRPISEDGKRTHTYEVGDMVYWSPGPDVAILYRHDGQRMGRVRQFAGRVVGPAKSKPHFVGRIIRPAKSEPHSVGRNIRPAKSGTHFVGRNIGPAKSGTHFVGRNIGPAKSAAHSAGRIIRPVKPEPHDMGRDIGATGPAAYTVGRIGQIRQPVMHEPSAVSEKSGLVLTRSRRRLQGCASWQGAPYTLPGPAARRPAIRSTSSTPGRRASQSRKRRDMRCTRSL